MGPAPVPPPAGSLAVGSIALGSIGRALLQNAHAQEPVSADLPPPSVSPAPLQPDASLPVDGITPIVVPNDDFYRIDTALVVPAGGRRDLDGDRQGHGRPSRDPHLRRARGDADVEQYVTLACVSNEVGGDLVGNALWQGVHLRDVLARAGVQPGATQIVGRSVDGFTVGFPTACAMDRRATR